MAKERLSQLQRWLLLFCYNQGKYNEEYANVVNAHNFPVGIDYFAYRDDLRRECSQGYYKNSNKLKYATDKEERNHIRNKLEVATHNSIKNLRKKGYIAELPAFGHHLIENWMWRGFWLTKKGVELVEKVLLLGLIGTK